MNKKMMDNFGQETQSTIMSLNRNEANASCFLWCRFFINIILLPFYLIYFLFNSFISSCTIRDVRENPEYWLRIYQEDPERMRKELFEWILSDPKQAASTVFALIGLGEKECEEPQFKAIITSCILEEQDIWVRSHRNYCNQPQEFWRAFTSLSQ